MGSDKVDVRHNCWTCRHDGKGPLGCGAMGEDGVETRDRLKRILREAIDVWIDASGSGGPWSDEHEWAMPRKDADGCPGWQERR